ncbi:gamma-glutamylcyclotransferase [Pendulispora rubella]|uniref:glutathione-specific gamma-glutamylcyclotransferase n=1 Tax=Pendulispora rubella TaxID=2741070 RepID=A0ABZ2KWP7_9BACT
MWIFAYGSLIFRPSFDYLEQRRAFVAGWTRRFWQGSPDHRGTPETPGRVVTLVADEHAWCGGAAFRIDPAQGEAVLAMLDAREQAGFERHRLALWDSPNATSPFADGLTYVASTANPHFLGPLDEAAIAAWIARSRGPSGPNSDYARNLHDALHALGIDDPHVRTIAQLLGRLSAAPPSALPDPAS